MPAPAVSAAATPVIHSGYVQAATATLLLAALAITAATGLLARKRLAWETWLDMPVGLTAALTAGTETPSQLLLGEPASATTSPAQTAPDKDGLSCSASRTRDGPVSAAGTSVLR